MELYDCRSTPGRTRGIAAAVSAVRDGDLVVLPTDTVYGVGADAFRPESVARLLAAKGRGRQMPPPVLIGSTDAALSLAGSLPAAATDLMRAFWPGALTIVVEHAPDVVWDLGDRVGSVALRMPRDRLALEILERTGALAVSSANRTGQPSAETAAEAREQLGDSVRVYLEAGPSTERLPSTIVDLTSRPFRVLRVGAIPVRKVADVVGELVAAKEG